MKSSRKIYQVKVALNGIEPSIWRRFFVQSDITFEDFHDVLQVVMGWEDYHLYEFRFKKAVIAPDPDEDHALPNGVQLLEDWETQLDELFAREKSCVYAYDFGDGWEHTVQVEKVLEAEQGTRYPVCVDGARQCPPEDCGGIWGYNELLEILADPSHPEYEERREWLLGDDSPGETFDPEAFDLDEINEELACLSEDFEEEDLFEPPALEQWRRLYELAERIKAIKPWETIWDADYIAVRPRGREEPVYFSTMGRLGECVAVAAFTGNEAIARLERIRDRTEAGIPFAAAGEQDCLICYFGDREELETEDRAILKELGIKFRGRGQWIYFRSIRHGYAPWHLDAAEAALLIETMEQYLLAYEEIQGEILHFENGNFYLWESAPPPSAKPWIGRWMRFDRLEIKYSPVKLTDELYVAKLKKKKKTRLNVELDAAYLPTPIQERRDERPHFPRFILLVDADSGLILNQDVLSPEADLVDGVLEMLEGLVIKTGRPNSLHVRGNEIESIVRDWCEKLGVTLKVGASLEMINEALEGLMEFLTGGGDLDGD